MSSLIYLIRIQFKNAIKETLHKPGKLILYIVILLLIGAGIFSTLSNENHMQALISLDWFSGIFFAFISLFLITSIQQGLSSGSSMFDMSDVNLLFVSPLRPQPILIYGLVRLAKMSFLSSFFILFQSANLRNFGITFSGIWVIFFIYLLVIMTLTICSLIIYSTTNGNPRRQTFVKILTAAVHIPLVLYFIIQFLTSGDAMAALFQTVTSPALFAIPFSGWAAAGTIAFLKGNMLSGFLWIGLLILSNVGMIAYLLLSRADYYEDVLVAAETAFEKKRAIEDGNLQSATSRNVKVKVRKTGISGNGASVFFHKHLREIFRQNKLGFFSIFNIIMFFGSLIAAVTLRDSSDEMYIIFFLAGLMWLRILLIGNGQGLKEIYSHYIYMIPEPAFKKILWSNFELVFKTLIESIFLFGIPGIILSNHPLIIAGVMLTYTLFTLLLIGLNYLFIRWTGANLSQGILVMIYMFAAMLILLPGLVPALIAGFMVGGTTGIWIPLFILSIWEFIAGLICFALSKNILHNCDMPVMKV